MGVSKVTYHNRASWVAARNALPVLGSSDVGTIMGLNPYCTPYQYWLKQKNVAKLEEENENLYRGQFKEDAISKMFAQATGEKVIQRSAEITVYRNDRLPSYVQVAPDREVFAKGRETRLVLECKDTKLYISELDAENTPKAWYAQIQMQMGVMEYSSAYIAVEDGNKNLLYARFDFDKEAFDHIIAYCCDWFERYILGDEVPPVETGEDAKYAWPISQPVKKMVALDIATTVKEMKSKKELITKIEKEIEELSNTIRVSFEDNEAMEYEGSIIATYKTQITERIDVKYLKANHPKIAEECMVKTTSRRLILK